MIGLELRGSELRLRRDLKIPEAGEGEVRIRVTCAGICETDLQLMQGYMGFQGILGHEFTGIAENGRFAGQRVVGEINCPCGGCEYCRSGAGNHCPKRTVLGIVGRNGAFAESLTLPEENLLAVPDDLEDEIAVFTEPVAAAFQIPAQIPDLAGKKTLVLGDGRLGNLCAQVLKLHGAEITVAGKHPRKLGLLSSLGIRTALVAELPIRKEFDLVVDCTGRATGFETAVPFVRPQGTLVLKTTVAGNHPLNLASLVIDEIQVIGSRCGPFEPALKALAEGRIEVRSMIDGIRPLSEGVEALHLARSNHSLKTLLKPQGN